MFELLYAENVEQFEENLLNKAEQEMFQKGHSLLWNRVADQYVRQLNIIKHNPYPEMIVDYTDDEEMPPSIKHINIHTRMDNLYRWGIKGGQTGNHRIIFAIHNYTKVVLLYYFDKQYNGAIRQIDIEPAELNYERYCRLDPNLY